MTDPAPSPDTPRVPFPARLIGTGLFSGYIPFASGTWGTLVGLAICLVPGATRPAVLTPLILAGFFAGVYSAGKIAAAEGHALTASAAKAKEIFQHGEHVYPDPSIVVIDEIVGMWISLLFLPPTWTVFAVAFIAFRAFDILKPPPVRQLERIPGGWGIMLDDVMAGIYANLLVRAVVLFIGA
jgi:phosphatidylglycerophosphatase A